MATPTSDLLAAIRPKEEVEDDDDDLIEEQEDEIEEGEGEEEPKPEAKEEEEKPKPSAKDAADQYFARQRKRTKDLTAELEAERDRTRRLERDVEEMRRRMDAGTAAPKLEAKEDVNPFNKLDDPVDYANWEAERARKEVEALRADIAKGDTERQQSRQQAEQEAAVARYAQQVDDELADAFQEVPAFGGMFNAYNQAVVNHYVGQGYDRQAATRQATMDHLRVAQAGRQFGMTAAQAIYQQASRLGFDPNTFVAPEPEPEPEAKKPNLDGARQASRRAPRSINGAPGASGGRARSIEALGSKRDKDWDKTDASGIFRVLRDRAGAW